MFDVYPEKYLNLLKEKTERLTNLFKDWPKPTIEVYESPNTHYRMRVEFRIWHNENKINYVMFSKINKREPVVITNFPRAHQQISQLMPLLLSSIEKNETLKKKLFQMDFLCTLSGEILVTLIYHRKLDDKWHQAAMDLQQQFLIKLVGRARKQKITLSEDFILETLTINEKKLQYQQIENSFTQPNAKINEKMLSWAVKNSQYCDGDLLELYCGNGNFTLALAQNFRRILATEVSKVSVKSARYNMTLNNIQNINIVRMSSEEITQALNNERPFRRLADIDINDYQFSTLFVDPPRAGLDQKTLALASRFDNIIYISCNPETLVENLKQLPNYNIKNLALFDQFPYTDHMECGVILQKQQPSSTTNQS